MRSRLKSDARRALLIVPPFFDLDRPSVGPHTLQALCQSDEFQVLVFYANLDFAEMIGFASYQSCLKGSPDDLEGERIFSQSAFESAQVLPQSTASRSQNYRVARDHMRHPGELLVVSKWASRWVIEVARLIAADQFDVVGFSLMFEQICSSIALIHAIKQQGSKATFVVGGPLCEGVMAEGVASLSNSIDHVFSGEADVTFPAFLKNIRAGRKPIEKIIRPEHQTNLNSVPSLDYEDYHHQIAASNIFRCELSSNDVWTPYESSRGCWWGQKHHCHFCGLSDDQMQFRQKSSNKVFLDLCDLIERSPSRRVLMVDNIMPVQFYSTLLPQLKEAGFPGWLFYEQKANISFERMELLYDAGVRWIQPGIESLSDRLLACIEKGTSRAVNIATLRYASICGVSVIWNLLCGFPGDTDEDYSEQLSLISLLRHLAPPSGVNAISIDRFSKYHNRPSDFGIRNLRPTVAYSEVFPGWADLDCLAYYFDADYQRMSVNTAPALKQLVDEVGRWRSAWASTSAARPALFISQLSGDEFAVFDTRTAGAKEFYRINRGVAELALLSSAIGSSADYQAALERRLFVEFKDGRVPLATCSRELYSMLRS